MPEPSFALRPVRAVDPALIADFAARTWGEAAARETQAKWWLTSDHADAMAAVDEAAGRVAGMVVAVPSRWPLPDGTEARTVSICGWYVAPDYAGKGLGKVLVQSFEERAPGQNALSISQAAIRNFAKLGWTGPFRTQLLLLPAPGLRRAPRSARYRLRAWTVRDAALPPDLAGMLDTLEAGRGPGEIRRRRDADAWRAHLAVRPTRIQHVHVLLDGDAPAGYFVIRGTDAESGRIYRAARLHYVTDVVLNRTDDEAVRFLFGGIGSAAPRSAGALLLCTSSGRFAKAAIGAGWLSESSRGIGPRLAEKAPLYMLGGRLAEWPGDAVQLSFVDSDVDFNI